MLRVESADGVHFTHKTLLMTSDDFPADMTNHVRDPQIIQQDGRLYIAAGRPHPGRRGLRSGV